MSESSAGYMPDASRAVARLSGGSDLAAFATMPWTGLDGTIHERELNSDRALCGVLCGGESNTYCAKAACDGCIQAGIAKYARHHVCGVNCLMPDKQNPNARDRRVPQGSESAWLDSTAALIRADQPPSRAMQRCPPDGVAA